MFDQMTNSNQYKSSLLHRLLGLSPGKVPLWFLSRSMCECGGLDVLTIGAVAIVVVATALAERYAGDMVAIIIFVSLFSGFLALYIPFAQAEYSARRKKMHYLSGNSVAPIPVQEQDQRSQEDR